MANGQPMPVTVVVVHPQPQGFVPGPWVHGLCGCCDDIPSCLMSWFCPCIQFGQNYEQMNGSGCLVQALLFAILTSCHLECLLHMSLRGSIRNRFSIEGTGLNDLLITCCCPCCALSQEAREINHKKQEAAAKGFHF